MREKLLLFYDLNTSRGMTNAKKICASLGVDAGVCSMHVPVHSLTDQILDADPTLNQYRAIIVSEFSDGERVEDIVTAFQMSRDTNPGLKGKSLVVLTYGTIEGEISPKAHYVPTNGGNGHLSKSEADKIAGIISRSMN